MIIKFKNKDTEKVFNQQFAKDIPPNIQKVALRKLMMIDNASNINDLRTPPSNHLEKLYGDRKGQYSIMINGQWRICFEVLNGNDFYNVEIVDYH